MKSTGFTYVEVLVATLLVALLLVPAMEAFTTSVAANNIYLDKMRDHYRLVDLMERTLARSYASLEAEAALVGSSTVATSFSDPGGTERRRLVFLAAYDGDNADGDGDPFTGGDPDLLWVQVRIEHTDESVVSLVTP